jgi:site-specific recombinase XerD
MKPIDKQVGEYLNYCLYNRRMTVQTMRSKQYILKTFKQATKINTISDLTNKRYNSWIEEQLRRGVSGRSVNTRTAHVIAMLRFLKDMDYPLAIRIALIPKVEEDPPRRVFFTPDEIARAKRRSSTRERLLISLAFDSGMRISEVANLNAENICGCAIRIIGKGRKLRQTFVTQPTGKLLHKWITEHGITAYVFPSPINPSEPLSIDQVRRIMRQPFYRSGYKNFYPHSLRHSFGTTLLDRGAPTMVIKELMGHSSVSITENYLHLMDNQLSTTYQKYMPVTA